MYINGNLVATGTSKNIFILFVVLLFCMSNVSKNKNNIKERAASLTSKAVFLIKSYFIAAALRHIILKIEGILKVKV